MRMPTLATCDHRILTTLKIPAIPGCILQYIEDRQAGQGSLHRLPAHRCPGDGGSEALELLFLPTKRVVTEKSHGQKISQFTDIAIYLPP
jgi:hypothetical protein